MKIWNNVLTAPKDHPVLIKFSNGIIQVCTWEDEDIGMPSWFNATCSLGKWEALEWAEIPQDKE